MLRARSIRAAMSLSGVRCRAMSPSSRQRAVAGGLGPVEKLAPLLQVDQQVLVRVMPVQLRSTQRCTPPRMSTQRFEGIGRQPGIAMHVHAQEAGHGGHGRRGPPPKSMDMGQLGGVLQTRAWISGSSSSRGMVTRVSRGSDRMLTRWSSRGSMVTSMTESERRAPRRPPSCRPSSRPNTRMFSGSSGAGTGRGGSTPYVFGLGVMRVVGHAADQLPRVDADVAGPGAPGHQQPGRRIQGRAEPAPGGRSPASTASTLSCSGEGLALTGIQPLSPACAPSITHFWATVPCARPPALDGNARSLVSCACGPWRRSLWVGGRIAAFSTGRLRIERDPHRRLLPSATVVARASSRGFPAPAARAGGATPAPAMPHRGGWSPWTTCPWRCAPASCSAFWAPMAPASPP